MRRFLFAALAVAAVAGCAGNVTQPAATGGAPTPAPDTRAPEATPDRQPTNDVPVVPGYAPGQFPPIPAIVVPNISIMDETTKKASETLTDKLKTIPGLKVSPAHCGPDGQPLVGGSVVLGGDGSGSASGGSTSQVNSGEGAGVYTDSETSLVNGGDGSGSLSRGSLSLVIGSDGSGSYRNGDLSIVLSGNGDGSLTDGSQSIVIDADGSGSYTGPNGVSIIIGDDGSGSYRGPDISIVNDGKGSALVNGTQVKADPIPKVAPAGKFPSIMKMAPVEPVCGLYVTLENEVLFDYDKSDIRSDAKATLEKLVDPLNKMPSGTALQVQGHTDAHGSDDYNLTLSQKRAAAVKEALEGAGVTASITSTGYGEQRPVAPNEINGKDNPSGRQLNRRVEIFIPAK